jgi:hypothetical protein
MFIRVFVFIAHSEIIKILKDISYIIDGEIFEGNYLEKLGYSISIEKNDDFSLKEAESFPDGFLFFPYSMEIEIDDSVGLDQIIIDLNLILEYLWSNGYSAVTACDFEHKLIENGGYKSEKIPWPKV